MKKLYWQIDSDINLSAICLSTEETLTVMESDFDSLNTNEKQTVQYTITPVYLTDQEYANLPE